MAWVLESASCAATGRLTADHQTDDAEPGVSAPEGFRAHRQALLKSQAGVRLGGMIHIVGATETRFSIKKEGAKAHHKGALTLTHCSLVECSALFISRFLFSRFSGNIFSPRKTSLKPLWRMQTWTQASFWNTAGNPLHWDGSSAVGLTKCGDPDRKDTVMRTIVTRGPRGWDVSSCSVPNLN